MLDDEWVLLAAKRRRWAGRALARRTARDPNLLPALPRGDRTARPA